MGTYDKIAQWIVLGVVGFVLFLCLVGSLSTNDKPDKLNTDYIAEKLTHGGTKQQNP